MTIGITAFRRSLDIVYRRKQPIAIVIAGTKDRITWLKFTLTYLSETFPIAMLREKMMENARISFLPEASSVCRCRLSPMSPCNQCFGWFRFSSESSRSFLLGSAQKTAEEPNQLQIMWMALKKNGYLKLTLLNAALFSKVTPTLLASHSKSQIL